MNSKVFVFIVSLVLSTVITGCSDNSVRSDTSEKKTLSEISSNADPESISDSAEDLQVKSVVDISLYVDKREILIGEDDSEVVFLAKDIVGSHKVELINADTGCSGGEMLDNGDFSGSGDEIKGDAGYSIRFRVDDTFPSDPEVSEDMTYHYYARYMDGDIEHRSETVDIFVCERFSDKELASMDTVDSQIESLLDDEEYKMLDTDGRKEKVINLLKEFEKQGLVDKGSILSSDDIVSYSVGGMSSGIMVKPFDERMN